MPFRNFGSFQPGPEYITSFKELTIDTLYLQTEQILQQNSIIRSDNYEAGTTGFILQADGTVEFNGLDVTVTDILSNNWDGADPVNLATRDATATAGYALDHSVGSAQFEGDIFVGGSIELDSTGYFKTASSGERLEMTGGGSISDIVWYNSSDTKVGLIGTTASDHLWLQAQANYQIFQVGDFVKINARTGGSVQIGYNDSYGFIYGSGGAYIGTVQIGNTLDLNTYGPSVTGQIKAADGSSGAPTYSFSGDTDTGIYRSASGTMRFISNTATRMTIGGSITFGTGISGTTASFSGLVSTSDEFRSTGAGTAGSNHFQAENAGTGMSNSGGVLKFATSSTFRVQIGSAFMGPQTDNNMSCGANGARWTAIWAVNSTIQTSGRKRKKDVKKLPSSLDLVNKLRPVSFRWRNDFDKDNHLRMGFVAEEVEEIFPTEKYSVIRKDGGEYGFSPDQLLAPIVSAIQEISQRLTVLEQRGIV